MVEGEMVDDRVIEEDVKEEGDLVEDIEVIVGCDRIDFFGFASVITSGGHS